MNVFLCLNPKLDLLFTIKFEKTSFFNVHATSSASLTNKVQREIFERKMGKHLHVGSAIEKKRDMSGEVGIHRTR